MHGMDKHWDGVRWRSGYSVLRMDRSLYVYIYVIAKAQDTDPASPMDFQGDFLGYSY